ncbi:MAG TPA: DUF72 domain-containing protein [Myxococcales bacterium]|jgi:uncharacterized protein YecE (DUF72 family)|nr:DUF72 domain-containing protein [Myxococcales bacterium]
MLSEAQVGTSGFAYREWVGSVYPRGATASQLLPLYAQRLPAVEIATTYTRTPTQEQVTAWAAAVPPGFEFCLKAPNRVGFELGLKGARVLGGFLDVVEPLEDHLGPLLIQVPESVKADRHALSIFLDQVPQELRLAFDLQHASWHDQATLRLLSAHEAALVLTDNGAGAPRLQVTAGFTYIRIRRDDDRSDAAIDEWAERLSLLARRGIDVHAFLKHDRRGRSVDRAMRLASLLRSGSEIGEQAMLS